MITGAATAIGGTFTPALSGTRFGIDFDPVTDRLRLSATPSRTSPWTPTPARRDPDRAALTPAGTIVAAAYVANVDGAQFTTQFDIDAATDQLKRHGSPDDGVLTVVGPLGVDAGVDAGFDVSPYDDTGFAALTGGVSGLYSIDLLTGRARLIGPIGTGATVNGLVALPWPTSWPRDRPAPSSIPTSCSPIRRPRRCR